MSSPEIDVLFEQALSGDYDDDQAWEAIERLRILGTRDVFDRAKAWCESPNPMCRARGADILAQIGVTTLQKHAFLRESFLAVIDLLEAESDPIVLDAAITALGHIRELSAVSLIVRASNHLDNRVRFAAAFSLGSLSDNPESLQRLIELSDDLDPDVRDWATFGIGQSEFDSSEVREALVRRLDDTCDDARMEAFIGLGKRQDNRIAPLLIPILNAPEVPQGYIEASNLLIGTEENDYERFRLPEYMERLRAISLSSKNAHSQIDAHVPDSD